MKIKNWSKFQHFKDRRPPWIKLYRDLLDDMEWNTLDPVASKVLVSLWLIASEDENQEGGLPDIKTLAWRLRMTEKQVLEHISKLSHWLNQDDIKLISSQYQDDAPEKRQIRDKEEEKQKAEWFDSFWSAYPNKVAKPAAQKAFNKLDVDQSLLDTMLTAIEAQKGKWAKDDNKFVPHPATWLNNSRWLDEFESTTAYKPSSIFAGAI